MSKNKKSIGIMGPSQIYHLIPVLEQEYNVINLQKILDSSSGLLTKSIKFIKSLLKIDFVYNVFTSPFTYRKLRIAKLLGKKTVTHWIGTDVRYVMENKTDITKILDVVDKHVVCFEELQENLKSKGIDADILPITPFNLKFEVAKMPKQHAVIIYMPKGVEEDYGIDQIKPVFSRFPTLPFYIVANDNEKLFKAYSNVHVLGRLTKDEMEILYDKVSIVVRIHISDGLSMSILEGMAKGKKIIWNCQFPYAYPGSTTDEICKGLDEILRTSPDPDYLAHEFIVRTYTKENFLKLFNQAIKEF